MTDAGGTQVSPRLYVVDDDTAVRDSLVELFRLEGFEVEAFSNGAEFISRAQKEPACTILDVQMPGRSGLDILSILQASTYPEPIFIMSGHGDIPMAVRAIKDGAFDFFEKPFDADTVIERVRSALGSRRDRESADAELPPSFPGGTLLTARERQVLSEITGGASNKEAGRRLGISPRTIEVHRARIMEKLGARNAADLVRIVYTGNGSVEG
ncbi:response regulator transcription factor [Amorphus sp. 3PC139-8]|uniref:response regulator transcription factor n=1 Tax=Amorphus sp. 3PC139-8 TaxID=2735676 RepID=UPI00345C9C3F